MLFIYENVDNPANFTLVCQATDQIVVGNSQDASFQRLTLPEPPIPDNLTEGQIQVIKKEQRTVTWITFSSNLQFIAVTTENKQLVVFDKAFKVTKSVLLPRVSSKVCFSPSNDVLVADRTGDVYLYKMSDDKNEAILLLGHLSVILDMLVTNCGQYIITCDRDEKIRVSHFPNTYNIVTFCLGHTEFVTALKQLKTSKNILLSASGDGTVRLWNFLEGKQMNVINTSDLVDRKVLEKFAKKMDLEKVDVVALPVTQIDIDESQGQITLALSLYSVAKVYLYSINRESFAYALIGQIDLDVDRFSYCMCSKLYVLSNKFEMFDVLNDKVQKLKVNSFEENLKDFIELFVCANDDITLLYKRKFDNVQEYMERKKLRLESK